MCFWLIFSFSEIGIKICKIVLMVWKIAQIFVFFSEKMNFKIEAQDSPGPAVTPKEFDSDVSLNLFA